MGHSANLVGEAEAIAQFSGENAELREEVARLKSQIAQLEAMVDTDTLTPLANRRGFERRLQQEIHAVARHGTPTTLAFADLDGLKHVNDEFGHLAGDAVLKHVAELMLRNFRVTDLVARIGGDEFALILDHADEPNIEARMQVLADDLAANDLVWDGSRIPVRLSCGITQLRKDDTVEIASARADAAMYQTKRAQRSAK